MQTGDEASPGILLAGLGIFVKMLKWHILIKYCIFIYFNKVSDEALPSINLAGRGQLHARI